MFRTKTNIDTLLRVKTITKRSMFRNVGKKNSEESLNAFMEHKNFCASDYKNRTVKMLLISVPS